MPTIKIESILGGQSPMTHFARTDQFRASIGIDPSLAFEEVFSGDSTMASGLIRPVASVDLDSSTELITNAPLWIVTTPKNNNVYIYDHGGSTYALTAGSTMTGLSDGGSMDAASGNGAAYYDNYVYFAKNTTIARYGPLDGSSAFDGNYWAGTLSKSALSHTTYPTNGWTESVEYPNHILHRHSDGRLYIADVVDNKGTIHYIKTTKTSVEGDTDNGSTYNAVQVGYGLWPTAMESYGSDLVIAFYEGTSSSGPQSRQMRAKLAFWDTTSTNVNKITWVEFGDQMIGALKNSNGILYVISGSPVQEGFTLSRFVGGYTFEQVTYFDTGMLPFPGGVDALGDWLVFGSYTRIPYNSGCVYSLGLRKKDLGSGLYTIMGTTNSSAAATSVQFAEQEEFSQLGPRVGWGDGNSGSSNNGFDEMRSGFSSNNKVANMWWSQMYRIGQPFKITKIRIPLAQAIAANMGFTPKIYTDDGDSSTELTAVNNTAYNGKRNIVYRPDGLTGEHNFWIEIKWTGSVLCTVSLPITIEYELIDD